MPIRGDNFEVMPGVVDQNGEQACIKRPEHTKVYISPDFFERVKNLEKLVEAADYLQHCRRRQVQMEPYGFTTTKKSVERASDQYDYLRGQVKL